ncbi:MAG: hypothetical protein WCJ63_01165 [Actinomycetes bacterium]
MSRIIRRFAVLALVTTASIAAASSATAAGSPTVSISSTSGSKVVSAKAISANINVPSGTATVTATIVDQGTAIPATTPLVTSGGAVKLKLTTLGLALAKQCSSLSYTVSAVNGPGGAPWVGKVTATKTLSKASGCKKVVATPTTINATTASRCEFIADSAQRCMLPYPSNWFTRKDATSDTGLRVNIVRDSMIANHAGVHIDPTEWNKDNGFSPDPKIMATLPGLIKDTDTAAQILSVSANTGWPTVATIGNYNLASSPVVLVDKATGVRQPVWAELDATVGKSGKPLLIHPAKNLTEGHTYVVALRGFKNSSNVLVPATKAFALYRDMTLTASASVESRRAAFEDDFAALAKTGVSRSKLQLAWEFTVGSTSNFTRRMLGIRDNAFAQLGDTNLANLIPEGTSPAFTITSVENFTAGQNSKTARRVVGRITTPCYLTTAGHVPCAPGSVFNYAPGAGPDAIPVQNGTFSSEFRCEIPRVAFDDTTGAGNALPPVVYGHGLLGDKGEVGSNAQVDFAQAYGYVYCATDEIGFAEGDVPVAEGALADLSEFNKMADRTQQGMLNELYLGRALVSSTGLRTNAAFQGSDSASVIAGSRLFYDGNSQGGILGGLLTAIAPDFDHAVLGVAGMTYSTLLDRSVDFLGYLGLAYAPSYQTSIDRSVGLALIQQLWDRAEPGGYVNHMTTNPLPNTPAHQVLIQIGLGDFQVSNITADAEARTIGAKLMTPIVDSGRAGTVNPGWGLSSISSYPYNGSALVYFDSGPVRANGQGWLGNSPTVFGNKTPVESAGSVANDGEDPHEHPRRSATGRAMKSGFLRVGGVINQACGVKACYANGWAGN